MLAPGVSDLRIHVIQLPLRRLRLLLPYPFSVLPAASASTSTLISSATFTQHRRPGSITQSAGEDEDDSYTVDQEMRGSDHMAEVTFRSDLSNAVDLGSYGRGRT